MTRKSRRRANPRFAKLNEIEQTDQKIADTIARLDQLGKSTADVGALFEGVAAEGFEDFDLSNTEWSADQYWTALELICLCTFRTVQSGDVQYDPVALTAIALLYSDVIQQRADRTVAGLLDDYERGRKAREKGAQNFGTPADRAGRREQLQKINLEVCLDWIKRKGPGSLDKLTKTRQYQLIAAKFQKRHGKLLSPKIVERDLHYLRELQKKLDKRGLSK
jgi:hypothetical protein